MNKGIQPETSSNYKGAQVVINYIWMFYPMNKDLFCLILPLTNKITFWSTKPEYQKFVLRSKDKPHNQEVCYLKVIFKFIKLISHWIHSTITNFLAGSSHHLLFSINLQLEDPFFHSLNTCIAIRLFTRQDTVNAHDFNCMPVIFSLQECYLTFWIPFLFKYPLQGALMFT